MGLNNYYGARSDANYASLAPHSFEVKLPGIASSGNLLLRRMRHKTKREFIMKKMLGILIVTFTLAISSFACAGQVKNVQSLSSWTNQSGSTLYINNIGSNGLLTGTYINRARGYGCQNIAYPVTGWVYGTAITFTTIWQGAESCNSITAWTGFLYNGQIKTKWQLTINGSSSTKQILQGADTFTRNTNKSHKSLMIGK